MDSFIVQARLLRRVKQRRVDERAAEPTLDCECKQQPLVVPMVDDDVLDRRLL
jgi:hypothetical protein